jgi:putative acetyltransferase
MHQIIPATIPAHVEAARELFLEYAAFLNVNLCFQGFEQELATLPGKYAPPGGTLLLAMDGDHAVGCVALRPLEDDVCEMKRLFVRPDAQGHRLGERLINAIIAEARRLNYSAMRLDTLPGKMDRAINLYRRVGFQEIPAYYYDNPYPVLFLELNLQAPKAEPTSPTGG